MKASQIISRNQTESNPYGFARLRAEGIEISQELSGLGWTDYNFHDPGVTILEQVCFALTDLIYRTKFDVADYLCDERGDIDTHSLGLHAAQDVFFGRPSTPLDYQKMIYDLTDGVSDVQVFSGVEGASSSGYGLYRIRIRRDASERGARMKREELVAATRRNFHSVRNLCEDLDGDIEVVDEIDCYLDGEISIKSGYRVASVLADLFFRASQVLIRSVSYKSFSEDYRAGKPLDEVFDGPYTQGGIIGDRELLQNDKLKNRRLLESAILSASRDVEGIEYVAALSLRPANPDEGVEPLTSLQKYRLIEPRSLSDFRGVQVKVGGRASSFSLDEFQAQFDTLKFARSSRAYKLEEDELIASPPTGTYRDLSHYQSVQNQFPDIYGINQFGVPEGYPDARKAQALQLKSYLLLFEQIMSNYLANLSSIRQLFSVKGNEKSTYYSGVLSNQEISSLERVYPENAATLLDDMLGKIDDFVNRKSRLLDYLLALYGEAFNQDHARNFNFYQSGQELERSIIFNKVRLLNRIKYLSGDRAAAVNLLNRPVSDADPLHPDRSANSRLENVSGLQYRVGLFLGFRHLTPRSLVREVFRHELNLVSHDDYEQNQQGGPTYPVESDFVGQARDLFKTLPEDEQSAEDQRYYRIVRENLVSFGPLRRGFISEVILRDGVFEENYRYDERTDDLKLLLASAPTQEGSHYEIRLLAGEGKAASARQQRFLRRLLIHLNNECEGMHVLEHILLRPADFNSREHELKDKYANRVSVIFPAWTARCNDPQFREFAEELVRDNCPAHIKPDVFWLDFAAMCEFEVLLQNWQALYHSAAERVEAGARDRASRALLRFLALHKSRDGQLFTRVNSIVEVREDIDQQLSLFVSKLIERRKEIGMSERRISDEEQKYLYGIELLQSELGSFKIRTVEHMQLLTADCELDDDDWNFYLSTVSVILPKLYCFRINSGHTAHFHGVKDIVEDGIRAALDPNLQVNFHWLVPADMKKIRCLRARWMEAHRNAPHGEDLVHSARQFRQALQKLTAANSVTGDIRQWVSVLGEE